MAPGPPNLESNRFSLLDTTPKKKRKTISSPFPLLPEIKREEPKYITIESINSEKPLSEYSCFGVHRSLNVISKDIISITQLRDGKLLLLVKNKLIAQKFINTKKLASICDITVKYHEQLNFIKGTIFAPCLNNIDETEIVAELSSQGVVSAYKFTKLIDGVARPSGVILLTFDLYNLPNKLDVAWTKVLVRQYFPSPMRCKSCQVLGHTAKYCKKSPACPNCGLPPHSSSICTRVFCVNCSDNHTANSKECPKFIQAKDILKIKITNKCSIVEATNIYKQQTNSLITPAKPHNSSISKNTNNSINNAGIKDNNSNNNKQLTTKTTIINSTNNVSSNINTNNHTITDHSPMNVDYNSRLSYATTLSRSSESNSISPHRTPINSRSPSPTSVEFTTLNTNPTSSVFSPLPNLSQILSSSQLSSRLDDDSSS